MNTDIIEYIESIDDIDDIDVLESIISAVNLKILKLKKVEIQKARAQVKEMAASLGVDPSELVPNPKVIIKYRNPNNLKETWSGRGKYPNWLNRELAAGAKKEDFLV